MRLRIIKYRRMANGKYKVELDDNRDLLLYEDVILKYELLLLKEIDDKLLIEVDKANQEWDVYYVALKSLKSRFKSIKDLRDSLLKKEYPKDLVDSAINRLIKQGYLDDNSFARGYINTQIVTSLKGPNKISKELFIKGVSNNIIADELKVFDVNLQKEKIEKIINKEIKINRTRGGVVLKNKIVNDLINLGYSFDIVQSVIDKFEFSDNLDIAKKEYDKLYKKLSRKYSGRELEYKIKEKLYQKGLYYED